MKKLQGAQSIRSRRPADRGHQSMNQRFAQPVRAGSATAKKRTGKSRRPRLRGSERPVEHQAREIDPDDPVALAAFNRRLVAGAGKRVHAAFAKLKADGIIDDEGKRKRKELPLDMLPGSKCRLPG